MGGIEYSLPEVKIPFCKVLFGIHSNYATMSNQFSPISFII